MARGRAFNIYLNDDDLANLEILKKFLGESGSSIIRTLIESGANSIRKIATDNSNNSTLFPEIFELNDSNLISVLSKINDSFKDLKSEIDTIKKGVANGSAKSK